MKKNTNDRLKCRDSSLPFVMLGMKMIYHVTGQEVGGLVPNLPSPVIDNTCPSERRFPNQAFSADVSFSSSMQAGLCFPWYLALQSFLP
jgi:hypothetical protein